MRCETCGREFAWSGRGRRPVSCGQRCRKRRSRVQASVLPSALTSLPRWTVRVGKRPMQLNGRAASSTKARTWTTFEAVKDQPHGIMLGDGLGCYDLDKVVGADGSSLHPDAVAVLERVGRDALWVERSMSGTGLHVFVRAEEARGTVGERVSFYSRARFIAVTGDRYVWRSASA